MVFMLDMIDIANTKVESEYGKSLLDSGMEALEFLGYANLIFCRREVMRHEIDRDFGHLCFTTIKFTDQLLPDNLSTDLKDIAAANRAAKSVRG